MIYMFYKWKKTSKKLSTIQLYDQVTYVNRLFELIPVPNSLA